MSITVTPPPKTAHIVQDFYEAYWGRVREGVRKDSGNPLARVLRGRFDHQVTFCPDGVLVVLRHASSDSFIWGETSQGVVELAEEAFDSPDDYDSLEVASLVPGQPSYLNFDLDVACRPDSEEPCDVDFDRLQLRYVPFTFDPDFWSVTNGERLGARHLKGSAV